MAKKDVVNLLVDLFGDPARLARVKANPDSELAAAGLSADESKLVRSRNDRKIRAYLGAEAPKANIKTKTGLANIKSKTGTANIKAKTGMANIKAKARTGAIKAKATTGAIKAKTAAIKAKTPADKPTLGAANIKSKFKK